MLMLPTFVYIHRHKMHMCTISSESSFENITITYVLQLTGACGLHVTNS